MQFPSSVLARYLKAKHFSNHEFLVAPLGFRSSYTRQLIWEVQVILKAELRWRVGDGRDIKV